MDDLEGGGAAEARGGPARPTAIVIGAGFGGISAAGRLARAGYSVTCIERHATPGGRCCEIVEQGHRFDVGPSIILVPSAYREAFTAMGDDLDRQLEFVRVDPTYKIHFHDGTALVLTADLQRMEVSPDENSPCSCPCSG
jgi:phytoene dehydrogenase-like protein